MLFVFLAAILATGPVAEVQAQHLAAEQRAWHVNGPIRYLEVQNGRVSLDIKDADIAELLRQLGTVAGLRLDVAKGVAGRITLKLDNVPIETAIRQICDSHVLVYQRLPDGWRVVGAGAFGSAKTTAGVPAARPPSPATAQLPGNPAAAAGTSAAGVSGTTAAAVAQPTDHRGRPLYKAGEILLRFQPGIDAPQIAALHAALGSTVIGQVADTGIWKVRVKDGLAEAEAVQHYLDSGLVQAAERHSLRYKNATVPNDPLYAEQWGLAKIRAPRAWDNGQGQGTVVVAVIDTGVDYTHPELAPNLWINTGEIPGNGRDDDANGRSDDVFGWDFANRDADPFDTDDSGHGTHVAGIIAAAGNNAIGGAGVVWQARLMALKVQADGADTMEDADIIAALNYARANGARIVNCSFGGSSFSTLEYEAFQSLAAAGVLAVCAAGNASQDNDASPTYPAAYDASTIVAVAAGTQTDALASFSNWGAASVDLMAPGLSIKSTLPSVVTTSATVSAQGTVYAAQGIEYAGTTTAAGITATVHDCGKGLPGEFPGAVAGNIALIQRGEIYFSEKVHNAMAAGAVAVIVYNNAISALDWTLGSPGVWIPAVALAKADGEALRAMGAVPAAVVNQPQGATASYGYLSGTSMAAPMVSGAAALLLGLDPTRTAATIKTALIEGVDPVAALSGKVVSGGRLNVFKAACHLCQGPGDLSGNGVVGLEDAILALQVGAGGASATDAICPAAVVDADGDGRVGVAEGVYVLQRIAALR